MAQEWFEPEISGLTDDYPEWLDNWDLFVDELQNNFGPFDESANVEHKLTNLRMKDSQCILEYLVHFNSLAVRCPWGESALWYRFYESWLALLLTIHRPLLTGHCAQYRGFYYNAIVNGCRSNCIWLS